MKKLINCDVCGKEMASTAKACPHCGAPNDAVNQLQPSDVGSGGLTVSQIDTYFNRDVMINYLGNLRTLNFAKYKLANDKADAEYGIRNLGIKENITKEKYKFFNLDTLEFPVEMGGALAVGIFFFICFAFCKLFGLSSAATVFSVLLIITIIASVAIFIFKNNKKTSEYKNKISNDEKRVEKELAVKRKYEANLPAINKELEKVNGLLRKAYALNIIPSANRDIYSIDYLYRYMSTSMETFTNALFHYDAVQIRQDLNRIIKQQSQIILEAERQRALNEQILKKNEQILESAMAIEKNTAMAAYYSKISAINTDTIEFMQSYDFFYKR